MDEERRIFRKENEAVASEEMTALKSAARNDDAPGREKNDYHSTTDRDYRSIKMETEQVVEEAALQRSTNAIKMNRYSFFGCCRSPPSESELSPTELAEKIELKRRRQKRRITVTMYVLSLTLLYADYNILAPNLSAVAEEFGFTNEERDVKLGGEISLAFFLVGAPASFIIGWFADLPHCIRRPPLFALTLLIGEVACLGTYFVQNFPSLFVTRTLTGISIGGSLPIVYSVLGDLFQAEGRNAISGVVATATGIGIGIGQALGGFIGPTYGWRVPFLIVSIPAIIFALCQFFVPEPVRGQEERAVLVEQHQLRQRQIQEERQLPLAVDGASVLQEVSSRNNGDDEMKIEARDQEVTGQRSSNEEGEEGTTPVATHDSFADRSHTSAHDANVVYEIEQANLKTTYNLLKTPTVLLILFQGAPSVIPFGITSTFLNDYLAQDKGMSVEEATAVLLTFGAGNAVGVILGGTFGHYLYKRDARYPPIIMGLSTILACGPMWYIIDSVDSESNVGIASMAMFLAGALAILPVPIERAILANVTLPETRGRANAFLNVIDDLGKGFGPYILSQIIAQVGRERAFKLSLIGWLVGGTIALSMFWTVRHDEVVVQDTIAKRLQQQQRQQEQEQNT